MVSARSSILTIRGQNSFLIVMTAPFGAPFELCQTTLTGVGIACSSELGKRYFDLAFDGRYLYGASFVTGSIDKIDLATDGVSIFVPEPRAIVLVISSALLLYFVCYRPRRHAAQGSQSGSRARGGGSRDIVTAVGGRVPTASPPMGCQHGAAGGALHRRIWRRFSPPPTFR
jgi:hypothetical protein